MQNKEETVFWTRLADKKPPANTAVFVRGDYFTGAAFFFAPKFFITLKQTYDDEGVLSYTQLYGITHWAFIPPAGSEKKQDPTQSPTLQLKAADLSKNELSEAARDSDFFPPCGTYFTILTDDDQIIIATRMQDNGREALRTPRNSGEVGLYFRHRLGLSSGVRVTRQDLQNYGRADACFYKLDDENYLMDFSKPSPATKRKVTLFISASEQ